MAIPKEHLPHHGRAEGKILRFPKKPLSIPRRFAVAALGLATALTGSEITNATNFTGLVEPLGGVPAFDQPLIGGGSRDLNPNHSQATVPLPGGGRTPTTEAPQSEIQRQVADVAGNIDRAHNLTEPEFLSWANGNPITQSQIISQLDFPWNFPTDHDHTVLRTEAPVFPDGVGIDVYRNTSDIDTSQVQNATHLPALPNLSAVFVDGRFDTEDFPGVPTPQDFFTYDTLLIYGGNVQIPLDRGGSALLSVGTQYWGNGDKTSIAWISQVDDPSDSRLQEGGTAAFLGTQPYIGTTRDKNTVTLFQQLGGGSIDDEFVSPDDLRTRLNDNIGRPMEVLFLGAGTANFIGLPDRAVPGLSTVTQEQFTILKGLSDGYIFQDPNTFALSGIAGIDAGIIIDPTDTERSLREIVQGIKATPDLANLFVTTPYAESFIAEDAAPVLPQTSG